MIGNVGQPNNHMGRFIIPEKLTVDNVSHLKVKLKSGDKILCNDCELENESTLIDTSVIKTTHGYDILVDTDINILRSSESALTIMHGREIIYADSVKDNDTMTFNLPKGARINKILVENTGEVSIPVDGKALIEY